MQKPKHIAIIMDGNGRWAKHNHLPRIFGHTFGVSVASSIINACLDRGIKHLTLFALSTENMKRPAVEVNFILKLFERMLQREVKTFIARNVKLRFIGDLSTMPTKLFDLIRHSEFNSKENDALTVTIAVNYSGRWQLSNVCKSIAEEVKLGHISPNEITEDMIQEKIDYLTLSNPDLLIRTGSEQRVSNFMLWSIAYTEIYFSKRFWPDFSLDDFEDALSFFNNKERRYGLIGSKEYE